MSLIQKIIGNGSTDSNNCGLSCTRGLDDCFIEFNCISHIYSPISLRSLVISISCFFLRLQEYSVETAIATIVDGSDSLKINTQHLRELSFPVGSIYQFIGELLIQPDNEVSGKLHPPDDFPCWSSSQHMNVRGISSSVLALFSGSLAGTCG